MTVALRLLVTAHAAIIVGNIAALFVLPFMAPWYVSIPLMSWLANLMFTAQPCPLTKLEDRYRRHLGLPEVKHFMGHYFVWPLKKKFRARKRLAV